MIKLPIPKASWFKELMSTDHKEVSDCFLAYKEEAILSFSTDKNIILLSEDEISHCYDIFHVANKVTMEEVLERYDWNDEFRDDFAKRVAMELNIKDNPLYFYQMTEHAYKCYAKTILKPKVEPATTIISKFKTIMNELGIPCTDNMSTTYEKFYPKDSQGEFIQTLIKVELKSGFYLMMIQTYSKTGNEELEYEHVSLTNDVEFDFSKKMTYKSVIEAMADRDITLSVLAEEIYTMNKQEI